MKRLVILAALLGPGACNSLRAEAETLVISSEMTSVSAVASAEERGLQYAEANCAACHAVGVTGESALPAAPHFRDLGRRYPIGDLAEAFAEGIDTAHAAMPSFVMSTKDNADMIAYLKSIQNRSTR